MSTVAATVLGLLGQNALQPVTVDQNTDHVFMIVVNRMTSKQSSVVAPDDTPLGLNGPLALSAMNSLMNLF